MKGHTIFMLFGLLLVMGSCSIQNAKQKVKQPNVVYILTDQWRADALGYTGDENVKTPKLDAFAKEAYNFVNTVSVCPICTPYRASLLTGRYPTSTGMFLNDAYLPAEELCLAEIFKQNGYNTAYIGKWHLDGHGRLNYTPQERRQGFDYWMGLECSHDYNKMPYYDNASPEMKIWEGYSPFAVSKASQNYIGSQKESDNPFFLFVALAAPHFPHNSAPEEYKALYPREKLKLNPNVPEAIHEKIKNELMGYYAHCTATDKAIGELLNKLNELDMMDNTIVVFTSDHGEMMGAQGIKATQKQVPFIESVNVPFLIHTPEMTGQGKKIETPITTPDISSTLLSLAGIAIPDVFEGRDFSDILHGEKQNVDQAALYMCVSPFARVQEKFKKEYRAIKTKQYTYVKDIDGVWLLFNDLEDPCQMNNLAGDPAYAEIQRKLDEQLMSELNRINDDFRPAQSYLKEWGFQVDEEGGHIPYANHNQKVQSPRRD